MKIFFVVLLVEIFQVLRLLDRIQDDLVLRTVRNDH
jgi:hypothetical protein